RNGVAGPGVTLLVPPLVVQVSSRGQRVKAVGAVHRNVTDGRAEAHDLRRRARAMPHRQSHQHKTRRALPETLLHFSFSSLNILFSNEIDSCQIDGVADTG